LLGELADDHIVVAAVFFHFSFPVGDVFLGVLVVSSAEAVPSVLDRFGVGVADGKYEVVVSRSATARGRGEKTERTSVTAAMVVPKNDIRFMIPPSVRLSWT
jgi:hypothetical protein